MTLPVTGMTLTAQAPEGVKETGKTTDLLTVFSRQAQQSDGFVSSVDIMAQLLQVERIYPAFCFPTFQFSLTQEDILMLTPCRAQSGEGG